jgi:hypothetical protein
MFYTLNYIVLVYHTVSDKNKNRNILDAELSF